MDPTPFSAVGEARHILQLLHQRLDPNAGAGLHFMDGETAQPFQFCHELDALLQRPGGEHIE